MAPTKRQGITEKTSWILTRALEKLIEQPPTIDKQPEKVGLWNVPYYKKVANDTIIKKMRSEGFEIEPVFEWDEAYETFMMNFERLPSINITKTSFEKSLLNAKENVQSLTLSGTAEKENPDEEWEDVDTSIVSLTASSSRLSRDRSIRLNSAKKNLMGDMQESAKKRAMRLSRQENTKPSAATPMKKNTSSIEASSSKSERPTRGLKRQASSVEAPTAKKDKKTSGVTKTEFARSQNSRVQLVKERKELQDKERKELMEAKIQQKQLTFKEKERKTSKDNKPPAKKVSATTKPLIKPQPAVVKVSSTKASSSSTFVKPALPVVVAKTRAAAKNQSPVISMKGKAKDGLRQGDLTKQAIYHSILAGEDARANVNSTFLPGVEACPNFDASMALRGEHGCQTFVVDGAQNGTFISKPGFKKSPSVNKKKQEAAKDGASSSSSSSLYDSFNESFRDYGIDDLDSDSDNTDDENAPSKPVPKWADMTTARFKNKVKQQTALGSDIQKYGLNNVYMPAFVDLEAIFEENNKRFTRLDTSSGMWNDTRDFIRQ